MVGRGAVALATLLSVLAGCAGDGGSEADPAEPAFEELALEATATTGVLRGVVVDEAVRPVGGAEVRVTNGGRNTTTTADGLFGFANMEPGTYFLAVSKPGFFAVQQSAEVVAGDSEPPVVKVLLKVDATYQPYVTSFLNEGWIECTTSVLVLCGAPNTLEPIMCEEYGACYGNLTNDRFTWNFYYEPNMTWLQTEMAWESSQALSPDLGLEMETLATGCEADDYYFFQGGPSPIVWAVNGSVIAETEATLGPDCPVYYSVFAGGNAGYPVGFTVQQRFNAYSFAFYSYAPPEGWSFVETGVVPEPPG